MANERILKALAVTAELTGKELSVTAIKALSFHLTKFPEEAVIAAILRCQVELRAFPTVYDITSRIDDGRPSAETAWAMIPTDEESSVVWTDEMAEAFGATRSLVQRGDLVAARMAFKEAYQQIVSRNRSNGGQPKWMPSFGFHADSRATALVEAVEKGRISLDTALKWMPELPERVHEGALIGARNRQQLEASPQKVKQLVSIMTGSK